MMMEGLLYVAVVLFGLLFAALSLVGLRQEN